MDNATAQGSHHDGVRLGRTVLFGLLGVLLVAGLSGYHDDRIVGGTLMVGSHLPVGALCYVMVVGLLWNGLAGRRLALHTAELTVVLAVALVACQPATAGVFRYFQRMLVLPWHYLTSGGKPQWAQSRVLELLPRGLFPSPYPVSIPYPLEGGTYLPDPAVDTVYRSFVVGMAQGRGTVALRDLPLGHWWPCLLTYWLPLLAAVSACLMSLSLLVHRQWAHHEQLGYPLAQVAGSFTDCGGGRIPRVFRSRLFWLGAGLVLLFYGVELLSRWVPGRVPGMSEVLPALPGWRLPLEQRFPILAKTPHWWALTSQKLYFMVFGLAYFCNVEVGLTVGLSCVLMAVAGAGFYAATGAPLAPNDLRLFRAGAYVAYAMILLFTGRTYFLRVFRDALRLRRSAERGDPAVSAARLFLAGFAAVVLVFVWMGQDWLISVCYALTLVVLFLVFSRIVCETGIPFLQAGWMPAHLLVGVLGPAAVGPGALVFFSWVSSVLCQDPRECLMPFVATSLRVADGRLRLNRLLAVMGAALAVALVAAFLSTTWTYYNFGAMRDYHASITVPKSHFDATAALISDLAGSGEKEVSEAARGLAKLRLVAPDGHHVRYLATGAALVALFSALRFRFARFPLHPVLFLVAGTFAAESVWYSFLLGWAVKTLVVKFGGNRVYQAAKPLFVGIVAGELCAGGVTILVDLAYLWITGHAPPVSLQLLPD